MLNLLKWKIMGPLVGVAFLSGLWSGHYLTSQAWQAEVNRSIAASEKAAREGEVALIKETGVITKVIKNAKDSCTHASLPTAIRDELRK